MAVLLENYLLKTPFFKNYAHAIEQTERFGEALYDFIAEKMDKAPNGKVSVFTADEPRLCRARRLVKARESIISRQNEHALIASQPRFQLGF